MQKDENQQPQKQYWIEEQAELSNVWLELLGLHPGTRPADRVVPDQRIIPLLEGDPWRKLLETENIEHVDLEKMRFPISEREVEHVMQIFNDPTDLNS